MILMTNPGISEFVISGWLLAWMDGWRSLVYCVFGVCPLVLRSGRLNGSLLVLCTVLCFLNRVDPFSRDSSVIARGYSFP